MLTSTATLTQVPLQLNPATAHAGLSSLFAAAVVSKSFCNMLLSHPEEALQRGYMGKTFGLSHQDAALIISLNAHSLQDLAKQVVQTLG
jgi:hypothetical protein